MKFNPFQWQEVQPLEVLDMESGQLHIRASSDKCAVYVECEGVEVLAGYGSEINVSIAQPFRAHVVAEDGVRAFVKSPVTEPVKTRGEVYTNIDRMPNESGNMLEVMREVRKFKLEQAAYMRQARAERHKLEAARRSNMKPDPEPEPQPEPQPDPEPDSEPDGSE